MNLTRDEYKKLRDEAALRASSAFENLNDIMERSISSGEVQMPKIANALKTAEIWTNIFLETIREEAVALSGDLKQIYTNPRYEAAKPKPERTCW